ncbi:monovalent cation/H+ antiporter complex subunit F [Halanaerobaculum tunisiense]
MIEVIIITILVAALATFYRMLKGPTVFDRIVAADSIGIMFLLVLVLLSLYFKREIFIDVAIVYALLLFMDVLIMAKYFSK